MVWQDAFFGWQTAPPLLVGGACTGTNGQVILYAQPSTKETIVSMCILVGIAVYAYIVRAFVAPLQRMAALAVLSCSPVCQLCMGADCVLDLCTRGSSWMHPRPLRLPCFPSEHVASARVLLGFVRVFPEADQLQTPRLRLQVLLMMAPRVLLPELANGHHAPQRKE